MSQSSKHPNKHQSNSIRIIAGEYRSRKLEFPSLDGLRPTADRVRETLFNWLQDYIAGESCLDLFAGSGALGFESISRGASQVDFVENNPSAVSAILTNIALLNSNSANVHRADALTWLDDRTEGSQEYGLVFLDPPFSGDTLARAIEKLASSNVLKDGALIYIEQGEKNSNIALPENWEELKSKKAGLVKFGLYKVKKH